MNSENNIIMYLMTMTLIIMGIIINIREVLKEDD